MKRIPNWRTWPDQVFTAPVGAAITGVLFWNAYDELAAVSWWIYVLALFGMFCLSGASGVLLTELLRWLRSPAPRTRLADTRPGRWLVRRLRRRPRDVPGTAWISRRTPQGEVYTQVRTFRLTLDEGYEIMRREEERRRVREQIMQMREMLSQPFTVEPGKRLDSLMEGLAERKARYIARLHDQARHDAEDRCDYEPISYEELKRAARCTCGHGRRTHAPLAPCKPERLPWLRLPGSVWAPVGMGVGALALCAGGSVGLGTLIDASKSTPHYLMLLASLLALAVVIGAPVAVLLRRWFDDRGI